MNIEYGIRLRFLQRLRCLGLFKTSHKRATVNSSKDSFVTNNSCLSKKGKLSILNFLFLFVSFIGVFSILRCKTLDLKTTAW